MIHYGTETAFLLAQKFETLYLMAATSIKSFKENLKSRIPENCLLQITQKLYSTWRIRIPITIRFQSSVSSGKTQLNSLHFWSRIRSATTILAFILIFTLRVTQLCATTCRHIWLSFYIFNLKIIVLMFLVNCKERIINKITK